MKFSIFYRIISLILLATFVLLAISCKETNSPNTNAVTSKAPKEKVEVGNAQSPIDAYKMLYKAVKAEDFESIKKMMSVNSLKFAEAAAGRQNKPIDDIVKNGFYASTFAATLPDMRDERIKDEFGAVEVWVTKEQRWEDVAFIKEADGWKIAAGDNFSGTYKVPGISQTSREKIAANAVAAANAKPIANINANVNTSVSTDPIPKKDTFKNRAK